MEIVVKDGDIAEEPADALITAVNSGGMWFGGIDNVIMRAAGHQYHDVVARTLRSNPDAHVVVANPAHSHLGMFRNVIFVIDDLQDPLNVVVRRGLTVASERGFKHVSMPMIRFGVMLDVGGSSDDKIDEMAMAIHNQSGDIKNRIEKLTVVVYGDLKLSALLSHALHL